MPHSKKQHGIKIPKSVILIGKFLSKISTKLTVLYLARLFTSPIRHAMPKREFDMYNRSRRHKQYIPAIKKNIVVYHFGQGDKKVLLVHGWSGRGTQLVKIAEALDRAGYATVSFDAPAHGKSGGRTTLMPEFIACIHELDRHFGPFDAAVGHSLGGMSLLNALREGLAINGLVTIGSGDIVSDIMDDFVDKMQLRRKYSGLIRTHFERKSVMSMESYSAHLAAATIDIPALVIHDSDDNEVPLKCAVHIHKNLKHGKLMVTNHLGHRKILGNDEVLNAITQFIKNEIRDEKDVRDYSTAGNAVL